MAIDEKYKPIFTLVGLNKIASAINSGIKIELSKMALGDSNGSDYTPSESMTSLVNEVIRFNLRTLWYEQVTAINKTVLKFTGILDPGLISSKTIREVGVYDSEDDLIIIFRIPDRPVLSEGNIATILDLTFGITLSSNSNIFMTLGTNDGSYVTLEEYNGHVNNLNNPHNITKEQISLGNVDNTADNVKNVLSATKLFTARTITVNNGATGTVNFDGSANVTLSLTIANNSHLHTISNVTGLQTALDNKVATSTVNVNKTTNTIPIRDASGVLYSIGINANHVIIDNGSNDGGKLVFKSNEYQDTWIDNLNGTLRIYKNTIGNLLDFNNDTVNLRRDTYVSGLLYKDGSIMTSNSREYMYVNPWAATNNDLGTSLNYSTKGNFQVYDGLGKNIIHGKTNDIVLNVNKTTLNGNLYLKRPSGAIGTEGARIFMASPPDSGAGNDGYIDYVFTGGQHQFRLIAGNGQMFTIGRGGGEIFHSGFMGEGSGLVADSVRGFIPTQFLRNDQYAPQTLQHELNVGAGITTGSEGGQINFKRPPNAGTGYAYLDMYGTTANTDTFRMVVNGKVLAFPAVNGVVWSSGNQGSGSGLDADTVDGYQASSLMKAVLANGVNADNITGAGSYRLETNTGCPEECNYGQLLVIRGGGNTITQIASDYNGNHIYWRAGNPSSVGGIGSFSSWKKIIHDRGFSFSDMTGYTIKSTGECRQWGWYNSSSLIDNVNFHFNFSNIPKVELQMLGANPSYATLRAELTVSGFSVTKSIGYGFFWEAVGLLNL